MTDMIRQFLRLESAGGILLIIASAVAMLLANTSLEGIYDQFLALPVAVQFGSLLINKPLLLWINDGLMAIFFLLVGLEVKREMLVGALNSKEKAVFPAIAALGGMLAPALLYLAFNGNNDVALAGWAIPAATDIAFALGIMALLGKRVPVSLKVFLLALAIIDDLGVIVIIALFYTSQLSVIALAIALAATAGLIYMNRRGVASISPYMLLGVVLWVSLLKSGVHATLAGVILGFCVPLKAQDKRPLEHLEHSLHPWVAYLILPLFAFANAGVSLKGISLDVLTSALPLGIAVALFVGKPLGIFSFSWLSVKLGLAKLPDGIYFRHIFAVSVLCGIGFTMSMFIASLAFEHAGLEYGVFSRLGILMGSTTAAVVGYCLLRMVLPVQSKR
nr:Na+/H+ antiporter NhaA [Plesiomonas shigelloides]